MENKVYVQVLLYMYKYYKYKYLDFLSSDLESGSTSHLSECFSNQPFSIQTPGTPCTHDKLRSYHEYGTAPIVLCGM